MKSVAVIGSVVLSLSLACAVAAQAQESEKKPAPEQHARLEAQPGWRSQSGDSQGVGLIPNDRYRAHFGRAHSFHLNESAYGKDRRFQYGGYSFGFVDEWPTNWLATEDVFVIQIEGRYYLGNSKYPGVNIPLNVAL